MSWTENRQPLTKDQKDRGVIYSTMLIVKGHPEFEQRLHEVLADDPDRDERLESLKDVRFFQELAEAAGWDVINDIRE